MATISQSTTLPFARQMNEASVSVQATPTLILAANDKRASIIVQNLGATDLYIGGNANITTATAIKIPANADWASYTYVGAIYGVSGVAALDVRYMEESA